MTRDSRPKYAPGYDLFKLIVAVILTILLIFLLLLGRQPAPIAPGASPTGTMMETASETGTLSPATQTIELPSPTLTLPTPALSVTEGATTESSTMPILPTMTTAPLPTPTSTALPAPIAV